MASLLSMGVQRSRASMGDGHLAHPIGKHLHVGPAGRRVPAEPRNGTLSDRDTRRAPLGCQQYQQIRQAVEADGLPRHCSNSKKKTVNSSNGTSGGTCMAKRNAKAGRVWVLWARLCCWSWSIKRIDWRSRAKTSKRCGSLQT